MSSSFQGAYVAKVDLGHLLVCTFRYSLGRMSTAPSVTASTIRAYAGALSLQELDLIIREIKEADEKGSLGMHCDVLVWRDLQTWAEREKSRREAVYAAVTK